MRLSLGASFSGEAVPYKSWQLLIACHELWNFPSACDPLWTDYRSDVVELEFETIKSSLRAHLNAVACLRSILNQRFANYQDTLKPCPDVEDNR